MKKLLSALVVMLCLCLGIACLSACGGDGKDSGGKKDVADNTQYYDTITKELKLEKSYTGKSFLTDGIGNATVDAYTDGDTTRFRLAQDDVLSVRYYCIDTPESTGGVEKWGKAASLFTKNQLSQATEIVLEATQAPAKKDSYGTRYLGYVWYKTEGSTEFKNLNLELVENGFSDNKASNTSDYPYYKYFKKANDFARSIKLRLYSELEDPLFNTNPISTTIKELTTNIDAFYNSDTDAGSKVSIVAYLKSLTISQSGTYMFVAEEYDNQSGKTYSYNVYAMYANSPASQMRIGHLYQIVGSIQKYSGSGYQISGIVYDPIYTVKTETYIMQRNYYLTFNSGFSYIEQYRDTFYSDVTATSVSVEGTCLTVVGTAKQLKKDNAYGDDVEFTFKVNVDADYSPKISVGDTFAANGYQFEKDSHEITLLKPSDIIKK